MSEKKSKHFIKKPIYPGGQEAYKKFISENLKYPKEAVENKIEGTVVVKYSIDHTGKVIDAKIIKGIGYGCDEEAMRVVKLLKFEIPKEPRKLRVLFHQESKLFFKLPKPKKKVVPANTATATTNYQVVSPATKTAEKPEEKPKRVYTYTVKINKIQ